jgi:hypothetical protein
MKLESLKMNLKPLKSRLNNEKCCSFKGKSKKIAPAFIQNKPNFKNIAISVSSFETSKYKILTAGSGQKQTQCKPNSNPISERPKINLNSLKAMYYEIFPAYRAKKQTQSNPNFILDSSSPCFSVGEQIQFKIILECRSRWTNLQKSLKDKTLLFLVLFLKSLSLLSSSQKFAARMPLRKPRSLRIKKLTIGRTDDNFQIRRVKSRFGCFKIWGSRNLFFWEI